MVSDPPPNAARTHAEAAQRRRVQIKTSPAPDGRAGDILDRDDHLCAGPNRGVFDTASGGGRDGRQDIEFILVDNNPETTRP